MLALKNIIKEYDTAGYKIRALNGVSIEFRKNEFVSILGPSGCGKTTMLNIIGGLDRYTSGDIIIDGRSTKDFNDRDWDAYRNHSIGFVFQSYNLIPHQTVLANVELALTLSGVKKEERRRRAIEALEKVGLGDQLKKKPNQMSGGQMQRVAIARALVNNPHILLADEPTGALDTATSKQIMQLLKDIAKDRLVIMVTHNPELAEEYSTRIVKLRDGQITEDSNPFVASTFEPLPKKEKKTKKPHMSFFTALSLSLNNLMTKKTRTLLTAFAGSIGIIGIALILSLSNGVQTYIDRVEEETLSSYPIMIEKNTADMTSMMASMMEAQEGATAREDGYIYANTIMNDMLNTMLKEMTTNNLEAFKEYLESGESDIAELTTDIQYLYSTQLNIFSGDTESGIVQINPDQVMKEIGLNEVMAEASSMSSVMAAGTKVWEMLLDNDRLLNDQYDVIAGKMPESFDEAVLIVNENNEVSDYSLYALGLKDRSEITGMLERIMDGEEITSESVAYTYDDILGLDFRLLLNTDFYDELDGIWIDMRADEDFMKEKIAAATQVKIVGILRPSDAAIAASENGSIGYRSDLMRHLINEINKSEIVAAQIASPDTDIFTGKPFDTGDMEFDIKAMLATLPAEQQQYFAALPAEQQQKMIAQYAANAVSSATYEGNLDKLGVADLAKPSSIYIYPADFAAKESIEQIIKDYNAARGEEYTIRYTDFVGLIMSSVTTIINAISYILIAFVAISLVVSSIMIGIITYISVLERTKEIGILRSIGASKKDISRVFNAETLIVGLSAGLLGIGVTILICIPASAIIFNLTSIPGLAVLPPAAGVILVVISMLLTFIAGLLPSGMAAKKDPVVALRTE
ncbi:MAG: ABC transporter ATP-binding protein/permease [Firmicutes bacterium]|nr:ABC transporter ATP-binding protein/permease [Bacillota bacterium]